MPCDDPCSHDDANDDDEILALMTPFSVTPYSVLHGVFLVVFLILIRLFLCV
jgi:hypothetical protein